MKGARKNGFAALLLVLALGTAGWLYVQRPFRARMAGYVTDLSGRTQAQRQNIQRAGLSVSGTILKSGEVFSLNDLAGPYTAARGFLPERSLSESHVVQTPGGGVCQVASTLYNAALGAGLQILERVPHTGPIVSVPKGRDATVVYGYSDLKFRNPYPYPVKIVSTVAQEQLRIEIWGKEKHDVERSL